MVAPSVGDLTLIHVQLPATEAERLEALFRSTDDRKLWDRLQVVLTAHRGRARQDIAADLGVHRKTVTRWINAYCDAGIDGLRPRKAKGKAGKDKGDPAAATKICPWARALLMASRRT